MILSSRMKRKMVSLCLALGMTAVSLPLWQMPLKAEASETALEMGDFQAAEAEVTLEDVRQKAREKYAGAVKTGFDMDLSGQTFDGNTALNYSTDEGDRKYIEVFNNLLASDKDQTLIIRFKTSEQNGMLFGAGSNTSAYDGSNMAFGVKGGQLRVIFRNDRSAGLKANFVGAGNMSSGKWHTIAVSFMASKGLVPENVRMVVDGGEEIYAPNNWKVGITGFNQRKNTPYTAFQIGGGSMVSIGNGDISGKAAFNGQIDFITVLDEAYSVEDLQRFSMRDRDFTNFGSMYMAKTGKTWLFTGGTEAVADFRVNGFTRNWVGLFEDKFRDAGPTAGYNYIERGRFVFNTSRKDADVAQILSEYDTRIKAFGTSAVGIMIGAADYRKGQAGVEKFKTDLQQLLEKIKSDGKLPLLLTPYPAKGEEDNANIALYKTALTEVVGDSVKVVDLGGINTSYINADGTLAPLGHQAVANAIKTAVGSNTVTNYALNTLAEGSYTLAKKNADGTETEVKRVISDGAAISVEVDGETISGETAKLSYMLECGDGQEISGTIQDGNLNFTVDGLLPGKEYILHVYDGSRKADGSIKESYRPVKIRNIVNGQGISQEYTEGNISVNEEIQSLFSCEEPMTWLFMGDSITHGIVTSGYDNVPQMFAKYLDEQGRADDIVLNTGVSNATLTTTLAQVEARLTRYQPDVVMIMLGTNDVSYNGENAVSEEGAASKASLTVEEYKERYKTLVRKIYENNNESSIVLRVPSEMILLHGDAHTGYQPKFAAIYDVASEMRAEIPGLNIAVVNHRQAWNDYKNNVRNDNIAKTGAYCWLVDNVHPNGRGNIFMFQQIIKELGLYNPTSAIANYKFVLNDWAESNSTEVSVTQRGRKASFAMSEVSAYADNVKATREEVEDDEYGLNDREGLMDVTLTLTDETGKKISKRAAYVKDGVIRLDGLDTERAYQAEVSAKHAVTSKEITFTALLVKDTNLIATDEEKQEFLTEILKAEEQDISGFTEAFQTEYRQAIEEAKSLVSSDGLTITQISGALNKIAAVKANAEEYVREEIKGKLEEELSKAKGTYEAGQQNYTKESWDAFVEAYEKAERADEAADIEKLTELLSELQQAAGNLKAVTATDEEKKEFFTEISKAEEQDISCFTEAFQAEYRKAIEEAKLLASSSELTTAQISEALNKIAAIKMNAEKYAREEIKGKLKEELSKARGKYETGQQKYTGESWNAFVKAYEAAKGADETADIRTLTELLNKLRQTAGSLKEEKDPAANLKPAAPALRSVKSAAGKQGIEVKVVVTPVEKAVSYEIYRIAGGKTALAGTTQNGQFTDKKLNKKSAEYYAVAVAADGMKSDAGTRMKLTLAKTMKLKSAKVFGKKVKLTWKKSKSAKKYIIYRSMKKSSGYTRIKVLGKSKAGFLDKKVKKGKTYYYKIVIQDKNQVSLMSKAKKIKLKK